MTNWFLVAPGPRPPFATVAEALWPGADFDSDGDSRTPGATNWTELTVTLRPGYGERVDVDPVRKQPLVLRVSSESASLAERAASYLLRCSGGSVHRTWPVV